MLSSRLIHLIEGHWDSLTDRLIRQIRSDARLRHIGSLPDGELREKAREILQHLGDWLTASDEEQVAGRFERAGRVRFEDGIPLHEVVLAYIRIKDRTLEFIRDRGIGPDMVELYAEEEFEMHLGRFFDSLIYHLVRGYEEAMRAQPSAKRAAR
jgi:hypothetical protein